MRWGRACRLAGVVLLLMASSAHAAEEGLFGMIEIKASSIAAIPKWVNVLRRIEVESERYQRCFADRSACGSHGLTRWADFLDGQRGRSREAQLTAVHRFINSWPYITDSDLWKVSDYWETPREFVENSGDCEDYAIAKYISLKELGWPDDALRMAVVHDTVRDIPHAVLVVDHAETFWVLDNLATKPLPHRQVLQYRPYYAVNQNNRWVFIQPAE